MGADSLLRDPSEAATQLAAQQRRDKINAFYSNLQTKSRTVDGDIGELLSVLGFKEATRFVEEAPRVPDPDMQDKCKKYFFEHVDGPAREAIRKRDLMGLRKLLGPKLYEADQAYVKKTRENHWAWLRVKCRLEVERIKAKIYIRFAIENGFPSQLSEKQQEIFRKGIDETLHATLAFKRAQQIVAVWVLGEALEATVTQHLDQLLQKELEAPIHGISCSDLSSLLYVQREQWLSLLADANRFVAAQTELHQEYVGLSIEANLRKLWTEFQAPFNSETHPSESSSREKEFAALKSSRLSELGLAQEFVWRSSAPTAPQMLLDDAACAYLREANPTYKKELLDIIEVLLQFGATPPPNFVSTHPLDWEVLSLLLKYLKTSTQVGEEARASLVVYSAETRDTLANWSTRWTVNLTIKESRRIDLTAFIELLCTRDQGVLSDERLIERIQERRPQAPHGLLGRSKMYSGLESLVTRARSKERVQDLVRTNTGAAGLYPPAQPAENVSGSVVRPSPRRPSRVTQTKAATFEAAAAPVAPDKQQPEQTVVRSGTEVVAARARSASVSEMRPSPRRLSHPSSQMRATVFGATVPAPVPRANSQDEATDAYLDRDRIGNIAL